MDLNKLFFNQKTKFKMDIERMISETNFENYISTQLRLPPEVSSLVFKYKRVLKLGKKPVERTEIIIWRIMQNGIEAFAEKVESMEKTFFQTEKL